MTLTHQPSLYPGMLDEGLEFFAVESEMKFIAAGKIQDIAKLPYPIYKLGLEEIEKEPIVSEALQEWHPKSEFKRLNQFLACRYGGLDFKADFENNEFKEGDYFHCEKRATCKYNGIICNALKYNGQSISSLEIKLMKLISTTLTNETISSELKISFGSFHKHKQALYLKLEVQTKQEVALIAKSLDLI